jgi:hypothetical protein
MVRPTHSHASRHQIPLGNLKLDLLLQIGEGGAPLGDEVFESLKNELLFCRHRSVCGGIQMSNTVRSNKLVHCGDVSLTPNLFNTPQDNGLVVFG